MTQNEQKRAVGMAAADLVDSIVGDSDVVGFGTGSTVKHFVDALAERQTTFQGAVSSSEVTTEQLQSYGIPILDPANVSSIRVYVDGADEVDPHFNLIKGGGGALTREKIVASMAQEFICIVDESKRVSELGQFPLSVEIVPMAQALVSGEFARLGGIAQLRDSFVTDNGNVILDVTGLNLRDPASMDRQINEIVGVVCHGIFARQRPQKLIVGTQRGVEVEIR